MPISSSVGSSFVANRSLWLVTLIMEEAVLLCRVRKLVLSSGGQVDSFHVFAHFVMGDLRVHLPTQR